MKSVLFVLAIVAALALPAQAAPPPKQQISQLKRQVSALKATLDKLQRSYDLLVQNEQRVSGQNSALRAHIADVDPCPITHPNGSAPPGETGFNHGNGRLWVALWGSNVYVDAPAADGLIHVKLGWWRGVPGQVAIEGRRLDGSGTFTDPPLEGYGETGFQPTGVTFPAPGCWEVTGRAGDASLSFVTLVIAI